MNSNMKNSGVQWIGDIPDHWEVMPVKYHFFTKKEVVGNLVNNYDRLALTLNGVIKRSKEDSEGLQPEKFETYQIVRKNSLIFKLIDLENVKTSRVGLSNYEGIVSPAYILLISNGDILPEYAEMFFLNMWYQQIFNQLGSSGVRSNLNKEDLLNLPIIKPSFKEQKEISIFLNDKINVIDKEINNLINLIKKYNEYKKSLITEVVTKGLNKDVNMRNSNIPWIGDIPEHWEINKGKAILTQLKRPVKIDDDVITCFRDGEVTLRSNRRETGFTMSDKETGYQGIEKNDLVVHGMDGFAGSMGISDSRGKGSPVLIVLDSSQDKRYIMYYLRSLAYNNVFLALSTGIRVRSCDLNWSKLSNLFYLVPPFDEQDKIAKYLDKKCNLIDLMIIEKEKLIKELEDYKKSLIFEYVTGKKEVKNVI